MMEMEQDAPHVALVLGGGGPLGIAWEAGMLQGWLDVWASEAATLLQGLRIVGTSAGAIVGAHLASHRDVSALFARQAEPLGPDAPKGPDMARFMAAFMKAKLFTRSVLTLRKSMGKSARALHLPGEAEWVAAIERSYAPAGPWPEHCELLITVIDADTGEFHAWGSDSGVPLSLAIAASCAVPCAFPLVKIEGRTYMDGGMGSPTNADVAGGCSRVVVLDPIGRMMGGTAPLEKERRELEAAGSHTLAFLPDQAVSDAIGTHLLDPARRAEVARLGHTQGLATAHGVRAFLLDGAPTTTLKPAASSG